MKEGNDGSERDQVKGCCSHPGEWCWGLDQHSGRGMTKKGWICENKEVGSTRLDIEFTWTDTGIEKLGVLASFLG